ncbi:hypothetical protein [Novimethylophilus kurashikiensis]|uniref:hypothetical protein n=1 Tax=Novimethylophilus kurashikiensis TaxID=1825523 RepID=UPI0011B296AA|nr:hypothetical protein [Novimethylophilus kurashikiensis]
MSNAAQVARPADGICTIARSGTSYTADAADPDCAANTKTTVASPKVTNQDAGGKQEVTANSDGSTTITTNIYNYNNNTTTTTTINYDSSGKVTGVNGQTTQGIGTAGGTSAPTSSSGGATSSDIAGLGTKIDGVKNGQCGGSGEPACKTDESGTPSSYSDGGKTDGLNAQFDDLNSKITSQTNGVGNGLEMPNAFSTGGCSNPSFNNQSIDVCETAFLVQPYTKFGAYILTLYGIWGLWFRRMGGAA